MFFGNSFKEAGFEVNGVCFAVQGALHSESALNTRVNLLAHNFRVLLVREVGLLGCEKFTGFR